MIVTNNNDLLFTVRNGNVVGFQGYPFKIQHGNSIARFVSRLFILMEISDGVEEGRMYEDASVSSSKYPTVSLRFVPLFWGHLALVNDHLRFFRAEIIILYLLFVYLFFNLVLIFNFANYGLNSSLNAYNRNKHSKYKVYLL